MKYLIFIFLISCDVQTQYSQHYCKYRVNILHGRFWKAYFADEIKRLNSNEVRLICTDTKDSITVQALESRIRINNN